MFLVCLLNRNELNTDNSSIYRFFGLLFSRKAYDWLRGIIGVILLSELIFICLPTMKQDRCTLQVWKRHFTSLVCKWNIQMINLRKMFLSHLVPASLVPPKLVAPFLKVFKFLKFPCFTVPSSLIPTILIFPNPPQTSPADTSVAVSWIAVSCSARQQCILARGAR